jgi:hypothetical protein
MLERLKELAEAKLLALGNVLWGYIGASNIDWGLFLDWAVLVLPTFLAVAAVIVSTLRLESTASRVSWRFGIIGFGLLISAVTWSQQKSAREIAHVPPPDVKAVFIYPNSPSLVLYNDSGTTAESVLYNFGMWNLNATPESVKDPLRIPSAKADFIRKHESVGPEVIFDQPGVIERLHEGDQIFGFMTVSCPICLMRRQYFLAAKWKSGGWYYELPKDQVVDLKGLFDLIPTIASNPEQYFAEIPESEKKPIITWEELKNFKLH